VLHELLTTHRVELIDRCRKKVAKRLAPAAMPSGFQHGIPLFLDQIIKTLQIEQTADPMQSRSVSGPSGGGPSKSELSSAAMLHGHELLKGGYSVDQVVHDYGDLCQAITDLARHDGCRPEGDLRIHALARTRRRCCSPRRSAKYQACRACGAVSRMNPGPPGAQ
jgi:hypothetical protein